MKLTVYFEGQFWVGVVEETIGGQLKAYRHIFGSEPKDPEIFQFVIQELSRVADVLSRSRGVEGELDTGARRVNPKRLARLAARELNRRGISTFAQEALKEELLLRKKERKSLGRDERERQQAYKREQKVLKAKQKHRGR
ncbi:MULTISPECIES: YjdF family protein [Paenibacillus]|uniref:YjdF family protein n=1 Tax=Paenibacillus TaxID=44249 RepID=UPI002FE31594